MKHRSFKNLASLISHLQGQGIYVLSRRDALQQLVCSPQALEAAARRLRKKGELVTPRRGLYITVPPEYRQAQAPPPTWFIDDLMKFHQQPYYVGLLSAAEIHGAAHQRPQEFQVITDRPLRPAKAGLARIHFYVKRHIEKTPTVKVKTHTGYIQVSTPEATAFDLVRYSNVVGYLDNVATLLAELAERMRSSRLVAVAKAGVELSIIQRTGYLLDHVGAGHLTNRLVAWVEKQKPRTIPIRPDKPSSSTNLKDDRWMVIVNEEVDPDV